MSILHYDCLICGKPFRGGSDLRRHQWGVSIQHTTSCDANEAYPCQCNGCGIYFKTSQHLTQHKSNKFPICHQNIRPISAEIRKLYHHLDVNNQESRTSTSESGTIEDSDSAVITRSQKRKEESPPKPAAKKANLKVITNFKESPERKSNTMECMVCGKVFARGAADLERHKTAITLNHFFSLEKSSVCKYPCTKCRLYFSQPEHLEMHREQTSCNPNHIPQSPATKSIKTPTSAATEPSSYPSAERRSSRYQPPLSEPSSVSSTTSSRPPSATRQEAPVVFESWQAVYARPKRSRTLVPQGKLIMYAAADDTEMAHDIVDRKAFFSVASLLIDSSLVPPGLQLTAENFEEYIPVENRGPIEKLKQ
jgi:hypothetical protein